VALPQFFQCEALNDFNDHFSLLEKLRTCADEAIATPIWHYFSKQYAHQLPIAAITGLADGIDTREGNWLRADPVDLQTDINSVYFFGIRHLDVNLTQARHIAEELKPLFVELGYELFTPHPYRWYLKLPETVNIATPAPETMMGATIRDYLTEVDVSWRRLFTEVQMVLQKCEVNQLLKRPITGLWFWGEGELPEPPKLPWKAIATDDLVATGLAKLSNCKSLNLKTLQAEDLVNMSDTLIVLDDMDRLQSRLLQPLYQALRKRQIGELELYLGNEHLLRIKAKNVPAMWKFWAA
jgi:hypothetical protein